MSVASFILGLLSIFFGCYPAIGIIMGILAIIFAWNGISSVNRGKKVAGGKGMAIAGLIFGILGTAFMIYLYSNPNSLSNLYSQTETKTSGTPKTTFEKKADNFGITEGPKIKHTKYGSECISGIVYNGSKNEYSYVSITFILYDKKGNQVGTANDSINNLKPYGNWAFECPILEDKAYSFGEAEIKGW